MKKESNPMPPEGVKRPAPPPAPPPIAYNHDKAKVTCSECAREVERLRGEVERLEHENKKLRFINSLRKAAIEVSKWPKWKRDVLR